jgi:hypothetical protein
MFFLVEYLPEDGRTGPKHVEGLLYGIYHHAVVDKTLQNYFMRGTKIILLLQIPQQLLVKVKVHQSRYRPGVAQRVTGI